MAQSILTSTHFPSKLNIYRGEHERCFEGGHLAIWCHDVDLGYDTSAPLVLALVGQVATGFAMTSYDETFRVASLLAPNALAQSDGVVIGQVITTPQAAGITVRQFVFALHGLGELGSLFFLIILARKCGQLDEVTALAMIGKDEDAKALYAELEKGASESFDRSIARVS